MFLSLLFGPKLGSHDHHVRTRQETRTDVRRSEEGVRVVSDGGKYKPAKDIKEVLSHICREGVAV